MYNLFNIDILYETLRVCEKDTLNHAPNMFPIYCGLAVREIRIDSKR